MEYVLVYARSTNKEIFKSPFVLKKKPAFLAGVLNLPGGKLEKGETPVQAGIRELKEETGLDTNSCSYSGHVLGDENVIHCVKCFVDTDLEFSPRPEEEEEVMWLDVKEVFKNQINLMPNLRAIIPLMESDCQNWQIIDQGGDWKTTIGHPLLLKFSSTEFSLPVNILVPTILDMEVLKPLCLRDES